MQVLDVGGADIPRIIIRANLGFDLTIIGSWYNKGTEPCPWNYLPLYDWAAVLPSYRKS